MSIRERIPWNGVKWYTVIMSMTFTVIILQDLATDQPATYAEKTTFFGVFFAVFAACAVFFGITAVATNAIIIWVRDHKSKKDPPKNGGHRP